MATTHDCTALDQFVGSEPAWGGSGDGFGRFSVMKFHVDMAAITAALAAVVDGSASDVIQLWDIPAGTHILSVLLDVTTAEGAAATVSIGDATSAAGFLAATSINAAAQTGTIITDAFGAVGGKMYAATDTLDLTFGTLADIDAAVFDVYAICCFIDF